MWIGCMVINEAHRAGSLRLAWVCMQGHHMSWLACCSIRFELKDPLCLPGRVSFSCWHGRKMQYKIMARRPGDLTQAFSVCSGWSKLGTEANERVLSCFQEYEMGHRFFVTLGPGIQIRRGHQAIREKTREVMLAKPVRGPLITVDLTPPADGEMNYIFMYTFSGSLFSSRNWFTVVLSVFMYQ